MEDKTDSTKRSVTVVLVGALLFFTGLFLGRGGLVAQQKPREIPVGYETLYEQGRTLAVVRKTILDRYVVEVDDKALIQGALRGMARSLDDHSSFMTAAEFDELKMESEGDFEGIGILVTTRQGWIVIVTPIEGTPAYRAGILSGDRILRIGDTSAHRMSIEEASRLLRGRPGTSVTLTVLHPGSTVETVLPLVRAKIHTTSVTYKVLKGGIGFVRLKSFREPSAQEMKAALEALLDKGVRAIVLDLRNNGGGLLGAAVSIADLFFRSGTIVSTKGRTPSENQAWFAREKGTLKGFPLAILINGASASASEILAGAVQDLGRGVLVGMPSFGKGSVQTLIPLSDGSALKLTTAIYLTPSGRSFTRSKDGRGGLTPDFEVEVTPEQRTAIFSNLSRGIVDPAQDSQLKKAIEVLAKR